MNLDEYLEKRKARQEELIAQKQGLVKKLNDIERTMQALSNQKDKLLIELTALSGRISEIEDELAPVKEEPTSDKPIE